MDRQQMEQFIEQENARRVAEYEELDPLMAMANAIAEGEVISIEEMEVIVRLHKNGLWAIQNAAEMAVFVKWCERTSTPFHCTEAVEMFGVRIYPNDLGDCVVAEAGRGSLFAVWTRKGRLHVGFKNEADALRFRTSDQKWSMEMTGNRHIGLVVIEGGDNPETIAEAASTLAAIFN